MWAYGEEILRHSQLAKRTDNDEFPQQELETQALPTMSASSTSPQSIGGGGVIVSVPQRVSRGAQSTILRRTSGDLRQREPSLSRRYPIQSRHRVVICGQRLLEGIAEKVRHRQATMLPSSQQWNMDEAKAS